MNTAKILAVDDEPDFELLLKQRFRQRIRKGELTFRFARHGEEALAVLAGSRTSACCCSTSTCR
jgi:hypothetical protein